MEQGDGNQPQSYIGNIITLHASRKVSFSIHERHSNTPRIGDIWVPRLFASPNHFVKFYICGVEDLFRLEIMFLGWSTLDQNFTS
jgi:hypothetical protein